MTILLIIVAGLELLVLLAVLALLLRRPEKSDFETPLALLRDSLARLERTQPEAAAQLRSELGLNLKNFNDSLVKSIHLQTENLQRELEAARRAQGEAALENLRKLELMREAMEIKLKELREENTKKLEEMRQTVDEKLQKTLDQRLRESFTLVSERLELVCQGLGEMRNLATGVGDLKRVLTNVKTRGTWGEVQLGSLLEQVLTMNQYVTNYSPRGNRDMVEFAIRLPGQGESEEVFLPIDAKFPVEDYQRLLDALDAADAAGAEQAGKMLELSLKNSARTIREKYILSPVTTDFAILFLPTEGLFSEVLRRPGLADYLQRECRVVVAGPTTLWSILNSLQLGFKTLAIEQRSSEVWKLLEAVKSEWLKYAEALEQVNDRLRKASNSIEATQVRVRAIGRKLREVQELPASEADAILELPPES
ncbi:MAG: DNA recombination protein RmuC [Victivallaceae bacterium]